MTEGKTRSDTAIDSKICPKCKIDKPSREFCEGQAYRSGLQSWCKDCKSESKRKNYDPQKARASHIRRTYGITQDQFLSMYKLQDFSCPICGDYVPESGMVIDHNHSTGKVRALLCNSCNAGIGMLRESVDILKSAINYLLN